MNVQYFKELNVAPITRSIVILDIDGTLLADGDSVIDDATMLNVKKLSAQGNTIYLVSNSFSNKRERNRAIAKNLNITYIESSHKKPFKASVLPLVAAANQPIIVVGDKFLTDGLLAVNLGVPFVEVRSIRASSDPVYSKVMYAVDAVAKKIGSSLARPPYYLPLLRGLAYTPTLTILTRQPLTIRTIPSFFNDQILFAIKKLLFVVSRNWRYLTTSGPAAVVESLRRGLQELKTAHNFNPWWNKLGTRVGVISSVPALRYVIEQKKRGFVETIIAGPNLVMLPSDEGGVIANPIIDRVLFPSKWPMEWWGSIDQYFLNKGAVWPAGVADLGAQRDAKGFCVVYAKNVDEKIFDKIIAKLWEYKLSIVVSSYGRFQHADYLALLKKAKFMVYLSESESQGLALHEAWMADVPTLVWSKDEFTYKGHVVHSENIGAPYLTPACGLFFKDETNFEIKLIEFLAKYDTFKPREYSLTNFTDAITTAKYLDIMQSASK